MELAQPPPNRHLTPVPHRRRRVHRRSDVQQSELVRLHVDLSTVVVVNDVADVTTVALDDPVVAVERKLIAATRDVTST